MERNGVHFQNVMMTIAVGQKGKTMAERTMVYLDDVISVIYRALRTPLPDYHKDPFHDSMGVAMAMADELPSVQPETKKYEYHYDHTDCIWYRPEARNRCPVTCAQYRDGWNDAMNYIFRDGQGYRPYRRDEKYGE